jgi:EAL domain-containing protein (putative c-di-GMP-specific phosphodiesterase class I)
VAVFEIDRTFLGRAGPKRLRPVIGAIVDLAHGLGLLAIAAGIEEACRLELMREVGGAGYGPRPRRTTIGG